ncbi:unnamed protein product [Larinioides sclopetarius]|uniref:Uncharacterized protein n=1 Tax=Larinioides sclopetarius TaxID=280406 RepID=A0AAV2AH80_9ARAC
MAIIQHLILFALASFFLLALSEKDETTTQAADKTSGGIGPFVTTFVADLTKAIVGLLKNILGG